MYFPKTNEWNLFDMNNDSNEMKSVYHDASYKKTRNRLTKEFHRLLTVFEAPLLNIKSTHILGFPLVISF